MRKFIGIVVITVMSLSSVLSVNAMRGKHMMKKGLNHMFQEIDTDGDGQISAQESANHAAARFTETDANADGFITEEEIKAHFKSKMQERREETI